MPNPFDSCFSHHPAIRRLHAIGNLLGLGAIAERHWRH
jgi:hypothetical protein